MQEPAGARPERAGRHDLHAAGRASDRRDQAARRERELRPRRRGPFAAEAIGTARAAGCSGLLIARADSAYYSATFCHAARRAGARFSVTVNMDPEVAAAIAAISEQAWTAIRYPRAIWDDQLRCWVSDAQVAETRYTAFTSKKGQQITARLIVRRVRDLNKQAAGQDELFPAWRYHAVFTDSPFELVQAEEQHRDHAIIEQVFADWTDGPLAHLPSGLFPPTRPGWPAPPSRITCCAPPGPWPAWPTARPAAPLSAATSSTSPPAPPGTATATSRCTCPKPGTAHTNG